jgi:hydrogenase large subunit
MLEARAILMRFMGSLAGHWPHTLCLQPGGVTKVVSAAERVRLQQWLRTFRRYLEQHTFGLPLEAIAALDTPEALANYRQQAPTADFACFLHIADSLQLHTLGRSYDRFIAADAYATPDGCWSPAGVWQAGSRQPLRWTTSARTTTAAGWPAMAQCSAADRYGTAAGQGRRL